MAEPRDDKVSAAFRAMPAAEPPPALDAAIRAAARRAVKARPESPLRRWAVPASVAAVLALSVGIALHVDWRKPMIVDGTPVPSGSGEYPVTQAPAEAPPPPVEASRAKPLAKDAAIENAVTAPKAVSADSMPERREAKREVAAAPAAAPALPSVPEPTIVPTPAPSPATLATQATSPAAPQAFQASPAPAAAPSPPAMAGMQSSGVAASSRPSAPSVSADQASAEVAPMRAKREASVAKEAVAPTPEKQLERIIELRAAGRHAEADEALARFRRENPGYRIPPETWEKVKARPQ